MKRYLMIVCALLCGIISGCSDPDVEQGGEQKEQEDQTPGGNTVSVSLTAEASFNQSNIAIGTLTLSDVSKSDVTVKLGNGTVEEGKTRVPADFDRQVTIPAGETIVTFQIKADVMGIKEGEYQFAIKINSANGADVGEPSQALINLSYVYVPEVSIYADSQFAASREAKLTLSLAKASTKDATITLELDPSSEAEASFPTSVTIPAGETSKEVTVTVTVPEDIKAGSYPVIIKIASTENCAVGRTDNVTINLNYPFGSVVSIDGKFDDWTGALEWPTPADADYIGIRTLKLAASSRELYIYFEIVEPSPEDFNMFPMPIDIFLDTDGSYTTGGKLTSTDNDTTTLPFVDSGLSWYFEMSNVHEGQDYIDFTFGAYKYTGKDGDTIWHLENITGTYGANEMYGMGVLGDDGIGRIEVKIDRKFFELVNLQAQVGVKVMNGNGGWACYGLAPMGNGSNRVDMALINMPEYDAS
ncbi:MAG: hypothetical protein IJM05_05435 [Bacteroidales bacterium]|nr:hypothetical protein [Bacteroidales bacterium]